MGGYDLFYMTYLGKSVSSQETLRERQRHCQDKIAYPYMRSTSCFVQALIRAIYSTLISTASAEDPKQPQQALHTTLGTIDYLPPDSILQLAQS
jgi:hypothetical protein